MNQWPDGASYQQYADIRNVPQQMSGYHSRESCVVIERQQPGAGSACLSVGRAAKELQLLGEATLVLGVPLSTTGKSPYFDRKKK